MVALYSSCINSKLLILLTYTTCHLCSFLLTFSFLRLNLALLAAWPYRNNTEIWTLYAYIIMIIIISNIKQNNSCCFYFRHANNLHTLPEIYICTYLHTFPLIVSLRNEFLARAIGETVTVFLCRKSRRLDNRAHRQPIVSRVYFFLIITILTVESSCYVCRIWTEHRELQIIWRIAQCN